MRFLGILILSVALSATQTQTAAAQSSHPREGFWWGLGVAYGWAHVRCDICDSDRGFGLSLTGRAGGTISQHVLLGAEANGWRTSSEGVDELLGAFSAIVLWYPSPDGAFYLKGGFGYVTYRTDDDENELTSAAFGPQFGLGYEFRLGRYFSLEPYLNTSITIPNGELDFNGDRQATGVSLSLLQVGLAVTWH